MKKVRVLYKRKFYLIILKIKKIYYLKLDNK